MTIVSRYFAKALLAMHSRAAEATAKRDEDGGTLPLHNMRNNVAGAPSEKLVPFISSPLEKRS